MKKLSILIITIMIIQATGVSQSCLPDGIAFTTQSQIDSFQINHPNCTEIEGDVVIGGLSSTDIANLNGLSVLTSIGGNVLIQGNPQLTALAGLDSLTTIGGSLSIKQNDTLQTLNGLEGMSIIIGELAIYMNRDLTTLSGLDNITSIGINLIIDLNGSLEVLSGLENLTFIGGDLYIGGVEPLMWMGNPALSTLANLENLSTVSGELVIAGNGSLINLSGIDNINGGTISGLEIWRNINLSSCHVQSVCDYLAAPNGIIWISENAPGCNSPEEVEEACNTLSIEDISIHEDLTVYPNPACTELFISNNSGAKITDVKIYNQVGHRVMYQEKVSQPLDVSALRSGIYVIEVTMGNRIMRGKFVK